MMKRNSVLLTIFIMMMFVLAACDTGIKPAIESNLTSETIATPVAPVESQDEMTVAEPVETVDQAEETPFDDAENLTAQENTTEVENPSVEETSMEDEVEAIEEIDSIENTTELNEVSTEPDEGSTEFLPVIEAKPLPVITMPNVSDKANKVDEVRGVWVSYLELQGMLAGGEASYKNAINTVMENVNALNLNTVYFQVRPFADALYNSSMFPSSHIVTGTEGQALSFDPLAIAIEAAHNNNLRIEAWINPYRIRTAQSKVPLSNNNIAKLWLSDGSRRALKANDGTIIFNPALEEVRNYITDGVKEILDHYAVDGIHFDDYFYPTTDMTFDEIEYLSFFYDDDSLSQEAFRRQNVNKLIQKVYQLVHSYNRDLVFGISPQGTIETNYNQLYVDIPLWLSASGYVDYICPQVYYGFMHDRTPFDRTLDEWHALVKNDVSVIAGLAAYKLGQEDQWAGSGKEEWVKETSLLGRMIETAKQDTHYGGYALYRYDFVFRPSDVLKDQVQQEIEAMMLID